MSDSQSVHSDNDANPSCRTFDFRLGTIPNDIQCVGDGFMMDECVPFSSLIIPPGGFIRLPISDAFRKKLGKHWALVVDFKIPQNINLSGKGMVLVQPNGDTEASIKKCICISDIKELQLDNLVVMDHSIDFLKLPPNETNHRFIFTSHSYTYVNGLMSYFNLLDVKSFKDGFILFGSESTRDFPIHLSYVHFETSSHIDIPILSTIGKDLNIYLVSKLAEKKRREKKFFWQQPYPRVLSWLVLSTSRHIASWCDINGEFDIKASVHWLKEYMKGTHCVESNESMKSLPSVNDLLLKKVIRPYERAIMNQVLNSFDDLLKLYKIFKSGEDNDDGLDFVSCKRYTKECFKRLNSIKLGEFFIVPVSIHSESGHENEFYFIFRRVSQFHVSIEVFFNGLSREFDLKDLWFFPKIVNNDGIIKMKRGIVLTELIHINELKSESWWILFFRINDRNLFSYTFPLLLKKNFQDILNENQDRIDTDFHTLHAHPRPYNTFINLFCYMCRRLGVSATSVKLFKMGLRFHSLRVAQNDVDVLNKLSTSTQFVLDTLMNSAAVSLSKNLDLIRSLCTSNAEEIEHAELIEKMYFEEMNRTRLSVYYSIIKDETDSKSNNSNSKTSKQHSVTFHHDNIEAVKKEKKSVKKRDEERSSCDDDSEYDEDEGNEDAENVDHMDEVNNENEDTVMKEFSSETDIQNVPSVETVNSKLKGISTLPVFKLVNFGVNKESKQLGFANISELIDSNKALLSCNKSSSFITATSLLHPEDFETKDDFLAKSQRTHLLFASLPVLAPQLPPSMDINITESLSEIIVDLKQSLSTLPQSVELNGAHFPRMNLDSNNSPNFVASTFSHFKHFKPQDSNALLGYSFSPFNSVALDFASLNRSVSNWIDAVQLLTDVHTFVQQLISASALTNSPRCHQIAFATLVEVLMNIPVPIAPNELKRSPDRKCIWNSIDALPITAGKQLFILETLNQCVNVITVLKNIDDAYSVQILPILMGKLAAIADSVIRRIPEEGPILETTRVMNGIPYDELFPSKHVGKWGTRADYIYNLGFIVHADIPAARPVLIEIADYFNQVEIDEDKKIFMYDEDPIAPFRLTVEPALNYFLQDLFSSQYKTRNDINLQLIGGKRPLISHYFPEFHFYINIISWFKISLSGSFACGLGANASGSYIMYEFDIQNKSYLFSTDDGRINLSPCFSLVSSVNLSTICSSNMVINSEDDILHIPVLPSFGDRLGQFDSELLLSYLTVPYMRLPLIIQFFASPDRIHALLSPELSDILFKVVFEAGLPASRLFCGVPEVVPTDNPKLLCTTQGALVNEILKSPHTFFSSVERLLDATLSLDNDQATNEISTTLIPRILLCTFYIERVTAFVLAQTAGKIECFKTCKFRDLHFDSETNRKAAESGLASLVAAHRCRVLPMLRRWLGHLGIITENDMYSTDSMTAISLLYHSLKLTLFETFCGEIGNFIRNLFSNKDFVKTPLSLKLGNVHEILDSFFTISTRYSWNNSIPMFKDTRIVHTMHLLRHDITSILSSEPSIRVSRIFQSIYSIVSGQKNSFSSSLVDETLNEEEMDEQTYKSHLRDISNTPVDPSMLQWCIVGGGPNKGRFLAINSTKMSDDERKLSLSDSQVLRVIPDNLQADFIAELNLQTLHANIKGRRLQAFNRGYAPGNWQFLMSNEAKQCIVLESSSERSSYFLVSENCRVDWWAEKPTSFPVTLERMWDLDDLSADESWMIEIIEPIREFFFSKFKKNISFFMPENPIPLNCAVVPFQVKSLSGNFTAFELFVHRPSMSYFTTRCTKMGNQLYRIPIGFSNHFWTYYSLPIELNNAFDSWDPRTVYSSTNHLGELVSILETNSSVFHHSAVVTRDARVISAFEAKEIDDEGKLEDDYNPVWSSFGGFLGGNSSTNETTTAPIESTESKMSSKKKKKGKKKSKQAENIQKTDPSPSDGDLQILKDYMTDLKPDGLGMLDEGVELFLLANGIKNEKLKTIGIVHFPKEKLIPCLFLDGLIPSAITSAYEFFQDCQPPYQIRGYPKDDLSSLLRSDATGYTNVIFIKLIHKQESNHKVGMPDIEVRIIRRTEQRIASSEEMLSARDAIRDALRAEEGDRIDSSFLSYKKIMEKHAMKLRKKLGLSNGNDEKNDIDINVLKQKKLNDYDYYDDFDFRGGWNFNGFDYEDNYDPRNVHHDSIKSSSSFSFDSDSDYGNSNKKKRNEGSVIALRDKFDTDLIIEDDINVISKNKENNNSFRYIKNKYLSNNTHMNRYGYSNPSDRYKGIGKGLLDEESNFYKQMKNEQDSSTDSESSSSLEEFRVSSDIYWSNTNQVNSWDKTVDGLIDGAAVKIEDKVIDDYLDEPLPNIKMVIFNDNDDDLVLLNPLFAPLGSPLHSITTLFNRIATTRDILFWKQRLAVKSSLIQNNLEEVKYGMPDLIEIPHLNLNFNVRQNDDNSFKIVSVDHPHLHIPFSVPSSIKNLCKGLPFSLVLATDNFEYSILVIDYHFSIPLITSDSAAVHVLSDMKRLISPNKYFLFNVHNSHNFLISNSMDAALCISCYWTACKDYKSAFSMLPAISTDESLSPHETCHAQMILSYCLSSPASVAFLLNLHLALIDNINHLLLPWIVNLRSIYESYVCQLHIMPSWSRLSFEDEILLTKYLTNLKMKFILTEKFHKNKARKTLQGEYETLYMIEHEKLLRSENLCAHPTELFHLTLYYESLTSLYLPNELLDAHLNNRLIYLNAIKKMDEILIESKSNSDNKINEMNVSESAMILDEPENNFDVDSIVPDTVSVCFPTFIKLFDHCNTHQSNDRLEWASNPVFTSNFLTCDLDDTFYSCDLVYDWSQKRVDEEYIMLNRCEDDNYFSVNEMFLLYYQILVGHVKLKLLTDASREERCRFVQIGLTFNWKLQFSLDTGTPEYETTLFNALHIIILNFDRFCKGNPPLLSDNRRVKSNSFAYQKEKGDSGSPLSALLKSLQEYLLKLNADEPLLTNYTLCEPVPLPDQFPVCVDKLYYPMYSIPSQHKLLSRGCVRNEGPTGAGVSNLSNSSRTLFIPSNKVGLFNSFLSNEDLPPLQKSLCDPQINSIIMSNMTASAMSTFASKPLGDALKVAPVASFSPSKRINIEDDEAFPFDFNPDSKIGSSTLNRLKHGGLAYKEASLKCPSYYLQSVTPDLCSRYLGNELVIGSESHNECVQWLKDAMQTVDNLASFLYSMRDNDFNIVQKLIPYIQSVSVLSCYSNVPKSSIDQCTSLDVVSNIISGINFSTIVCILLSTNDINDLNAFNKFLNPEWCTELLNLVVWVLLFTNRIGHINASLTNLKDLRNALDTIKLKISPTPEKSKSNISYANEEKTVQIPVDMQTRVILSSGAVATFLSAERHYVNRSTFTFDPRFLVFEFTWSILLRERQVQLVNEFSRSLLSGASTVKQMIMGGGKTTVVGPLLCMMLADGKHLVTQVVPPALLEFSRSILRSTFSSVVFKRVITLNCDRNTVISPLTLETIEKAKRKSSIVITVPAAVKSLMLKFVECGYLLSLESPHSKFNSATCSAEASNCCNILKLMSDGVVIVDEVDLVLHPLRSELNFPIGGKQDLDFSPYRWKLAMHLINAFFCIDLKSSSSSSSINPSDISVPIQFSDNPEVKRILQRLLLGVRAGFEARSLQRIPHLVLLSLSFYKNVLLSILTEWLLVYYRHNHIGAILNEDNIAVSHLTNDEIISFLLARPSSESDLWKRIKSTSSHDRMMLNLGFEWLHVFLPHCLTKINRVSYGVMNSADIDSSLAKEPNMPRSRLMLAIPFVGKDVPSPASEFAHPDVTIGLTVLAFRYDGIRNTDFDKIISSLQNQFQGEMGPVHDRPMSILFHNWVQKAGASIAGLSDPQLEKQIKMLTGEKRVLKQIEQDKFRLRALHNSAIGRVQPLHLLKKNDTYEMVNVFNLFRRLPEVLDYFLLNFVFPIHLRYQSIKLSASGQELGGDILFARRIGFSGTPSDLVPRSLGACGFEAAVEGEMIDTLSNPSIVRSDLIAESDWTVRSILRKIACASPPFSALIDTGALITGMSNKEVAQYLMGAGLPHVDGVVYLDELDRKMIISRDSLETTLLTESGIPPERRFAYYDQVHTTGMDIRHTFSARAALLLGKDMTWRDYAQGAYRMRGIGKGQTIVVMLIPEVQETIARMMNQHSVRFRSPQGSLRRSLEEIMAWLVLNQVSSETLQWAMLQQQDVANVWRKKALDVFKNNSKVLSNSDVKDALDLFVEPVSFSVTADLPEDNNLFDLIRNLVDKNKHLIDDDGYKVVNAILQEESFFPLTAGNLVEQEKEQEQEQEKEQQNERQIEIERFIDVAYSRDSEDSTRWPITHLLNTRELPAEFMKLSEFKLYGRKPIQLSPEVALLFTVNYFNPYWTGARRVKNVVAVLEWIPSVRLLSACTSPIALSEASLDSAKKLILNVCQKMDFDKIGRLSIDSVINVIFALLGKSVSPVSVVDMLLSIPSCELCQAHTSVTPVPFSTLSSLTVSFDDVVNLLISNNLRPCDAPRYFMCLSLKEAETIRRIMHSRVGNVLFDGLDTTISLRLLPEGFTAIDEMSLFRPAPAFSFERSHQTLRFFDCSAFFDIKSIRLLSGVLQNSRPIHRQRFFENLIGCRRRYGRAWHERPVAKVLKNESEFHLMYQVSLAIVLRLGMMKKNIEDASIAFDLFDVEKDSFLSSDEVFGVVEWLGLDFSMLDTLEFIDAADTDNDGLLSRSNFYDFVWRQLKSLFYGKKHHWMKINECIKNETFKPSFVTKSIFSSTNKNDMDDENELIRLLKDYEIVDSNDTDEFLVPSSFNSNDVSMDGGASSASPSHHNVQIESKMKTELNQLKSTTMARLHAQESSELDTILGEDAIAERKLALLEEDNNLNNPRSSANGGLLFDLSQGGMPKNSKTINHAEFFPDSDSMGMQYLSVGQGSAAIFTHLFALMPNGSGGCLNNYTITATVKSSSPNHCFLSCIHKDNNQFKRKVAEVEMEAASARAYEKLKKQWNEKYLLGEIVPELDQDAIMEDFLDKQKTIDKIISSRLYSGSEDYNFYLPSIMPDCWNVVSFIVSSGSLTTITNVNNVTTKPHSFPVDGPISIDLVYGLCLGSDTQGGIFPQTCIRDLEIHGSALPISTVQGMHIARGCWRIDTAASFGSGVNLRSNLISNSVVFDDLGDNDYYGTSGFSSSKFNPPGATVCAYTKRNKPLSEHRPVNDKDSTYKYLYRLTNLTFGELMNRWAEDFVIVALVADWCAACRAIKPILNELAKELESVGIHVCIYNSDLNERPSCFRERYIPVVRLFYPIDNDTLSQLRKFSQLTDMDTAIMKDRTHIILPQLTSVTAYLMHLSTVTKKDVTRNVNQVRYPKFVKENKIVQFVENSLLGCIIHLLPLINATLENNLHLTPESIEFPDSIVKCALAEVIYDPQCVFGSLLPSKDIRSISSSTMTILCAASATLIVEKSYLQCILTNLKRVKTEEFSDDKNDNILQYTMMKRKQNKNNKITALPSTENSDDVAVENTSDTAAYKRRRVDDVSSPEVDVQNFFSNNVSSLGNLLSLENNIIDTPQIIGSYALPSDISRVLPFTRLAVDLVESAIEFQLELQSKSSDVHHILQKNITHQVVQILEVLQATHNQQNEPMLPLIPVVKRIISIIVPHIRSILDQILFHLPASDQIFVEALKHLAVIECDSSFVRLPSSLTSHPERLASPGVLNCMRESYLLRLFPSLLISARGLSIFNSNQEARIIANESSIGLIKEAVKVGFHLDAFPKTLNSGVSLVSAAAAGNNVDMLKFLLSSGASIDSNVMQLYVESTSSSKPSNSNTRSVYSSYSSYSSSSFKPNTPLLAYEVASYLGNAEVLTFLSNMKCFPGRSLSFAAIAGNSKIVRMLLNAGVSPVASICNYSPIDIALMDGRVESASDMLKFVSRFHTIPCKKCSPLKKILNSFQYSGGYSGYTSYSSESNVSPNEFVDANAVLPLALFKPSAASNSGNILTTLAKSASYTAISSLRVLFHHIPELRLFNFTSIPSEHQAFYNFTEIQLRFLTQNAISCENGTSEKTKAVNALYAFLYANLKHMSLDGQLEQKALNTDFSLTALEIVIWAGDMETLDGAWIRACGQIDEDIRKADEERRETARKYAEKLKLKMKNEGYGRNFTGFGDSFFSEFDGNNGDEEYSVHKVSTLKKLLNSSMIEITVKTQNFPLRKKLLSLGCPVSKAHSDAFHLYDYQPYKLYNHLVSDAFEYFDGNYGCHFSPMMADPLFSHSRSNIFKALLPLIVEKASFYNKNIQNVYSSLNDAISFMGCGYNRNATTIGVVNSTNLITSYSVNDVIGNGASLCLSHGIFWDDDALPSHLTEDEISLLKNKLKTPLDVQMLLSCKRIVRDFIEPSIKSRMVYGYHSVRTFESRTTTAVRRKKEQSYRRKNFERLHASEKTALLLKLRQNKNTPVQAIHNDAIQLPFAYFVSSASDEREFWFHQISYAAIDDYPKYSWAVRDYGTLDSFSKRKSFLISRIKINHRKLKSLNRSRLGYFHNLNFNSLYTATSNKEANKWYSDSNPTSQYITSKVPFTFIKYLSLIPVFSLHHKIDENTFKSGLQHSSTSIRDCVKWFKKKYSENQNNLEDDEGEQDLIVSTLLHRLSNCASANDTSGFVSVLSTAVCDPDRLLDLNVDTTIRAESKYNQSTKSKFESNTKPMINTKGDSTPLSSSTKQLIKELVDDFYNRLSNISTISDHYIPSLFVTDRSSALNFARLLATREMKSREDDFNFKLVKHCLQLYPEIIATVLWIRSYGDADCVTAFAPLSEYIEKQTQESNTTRSGISLSIIDSVEDLIDLGHSIAKNEGSIDIASRATIFGRSRAIAEVNSLSEKNSSIRKEMMNILRKHANSTVSSELENEAFEELKANVINILCQRIPLVFRLSNCIIDSSFLSEDINIIKPQCVRVNRVLSLRNELAIRCILEPACTYPGINMGAGYNSRCDSWLETNAPLIEQIGVSDLFTLDLIKFGTLLMSIRDEMQNSVNAIELLNIIDTHKLESLLEKPIFVECTHKSFNDRQVNRFLYKYALFKDKHVTHSPVTPMDAELAGFAGFSIELNNIKNWDQHVFTQNIRSVFRDHVAKGNKTKINPRIKDIFKALDEDKYIDSHDINKVKELMENDTLQEFQIPYFFNMLHTDDEYLCSLNSAPTYKSNKSNTDDYVDQWGDDHEDISGPEDQ